jgi:hypothetical protein
MLVGLLLVDATSAGLREDPLGRVLVLFGLGAAGVAAFVAVTAALHSPELGQLRRVFRRGRPSAAA